MIGPQSWQRSNPVGVRVRCYPYYHMIVPYVIDKQWLEMSGKLVIGNRTMLLIILITLIRAELWRLVIGDRLIIIIMIVY